jgi:hypothetical protein
MQVVRDRAGGERHTSRRLPIGEPANNTAIFRKFHQGARIATGSVLVLSGMCRTGCQPLTLAGRGSPIRCSQGNKPKRICHYVAGKPRVQRPEGAAGH